MQSSLTMFLKNAPLFEDLMLTELEEITPLFTQLTVAKDTVIFHQDDIGEEFYIVKSGHIKVYQNEDGKEIVLAIFHEGDYFGEMSVLDKQVRSASAEAMEKSELYVLKRSDLLALLEKKPKLMLKFLEVAMLRIRKANELIKDLSTLDAKTRIVKTLLKLAKEHGAPHSKGTLIDLKITHQQLADMTSTVRETVTKTFLELQNKGILYNEYRKIIIQDLDKLHNLLNK